MIPEFLQIIIATLIISFVSFVGIIVLARKKEISSSTLGLLVSFAAGAILATVFFDLIPEAFEGLGTLTWVLVGIILFFIFESFVHWHHHGEDIQRHEHNKKSKHVAFLNLIGDAIHNFVDGVVIAASFIVSTATGMATTLVIGLHEIPQELGDFAILVKGGLSKKKAIFFNFLSAVFVILGGILGYFFLVQIENLLPYFISLAAGGLLYIATTDILPELHKEERSYRRMILQTLIFLLGVALIGLVIGLFPE